VDNIVDIFRESKRITQRFMDDIGSYIGEAIANRLNLDESEEDFRIAMRVATEIINTQALRLKATIDYLETTDVNVEAITKIFRKLTEEDDGD
jgi:hypothetical protein